MKLTFITQEYSDFVESCYISHRDAPKPVIAAMCLAEELLEYKESGEEAELGDMIFWLTILVNRYGLAEPQGHPILTLDKAVLNLLRLVKRHYRCENLDTMAIKFAIHDVFASVAYETCECTNYLAELYLRKIIAGNVEKLTSRKARGTIKGTGDNR